MHEATDTFRNSKPAPRRAGSSSGACQALVRADPNDNNGRYTGRVNIDAVLPLLRA